MSLKQAKFASRVMRDKTDNFFLSRMLGKTKLPSRPKSLKFPRVVTLVVRRRHDASRFDADTRSTSYMASRPRICSKRTMGLKVPRRRSAWQFCTWSQRTTRPVRTRADADLKQQFPKLSAWHITEED